MTLCVKAHRKLGSTSPTWSLYKSMWLNFPDYTCCNCVSWDNFIVICCNRIWIEFNLTNWNIALSVQRLIVFRCSVKLVLRRWILNYFTSVLYPLTGSTLITPLHETQCNIFKVSVNKICNCFKKHKCISQKQWQDPQQFFLNVCSSYGITLKSYTYSSKSAGAEPLRPASTWRACLWSSGWRSRRRWDPSGGFCRRGTGRHCGAPACPQEWLWWRWWARRASVPSDGRPRSDRSGTEERSQI